MKEGSSQKKFSQIQNTRKEFEFASKEGLIIVSLILFSIYAFWYKIFEYYYSDKLTWIVIYFTFSLIVVFTMIILLITGFFVFWKDRRYLIIHEKTGGLIFLIGAIVLLIIPVLWATKVIPFEGIYGNNILPYIITGIGLCTIGSLILARTGGFFSVWVIGVLIYLIIPLNGLVGIFPSQFYGLTDDFLTSIGIYIVVTSFFLFLYHDLKFFYLSRIIKKGNKFRKEKKFKAALECFNKALKIYPLFTTAWNNMGNVYFNQGKPNDAIKCYKKALDINPAYLNAKKNLEVVSKRIRK